MSLLGTVFMGGSMKYIKQFGVILTITFVSEVLNHVIPLPIPASIYGIAILFACLQTGLLKLSAVEEVGDFLVQIMPIMFVPAAVGLMNAWGIIRTSWVSYGVIVVVSTVVVMAVSGRVTQHFSKTTRKEEEEQPHV